MQKRKSNFFSDKNYSPRLIYDWNESDIIKYRSNSSLSGLVDALTSQDTDKLSIAAKEFFDIELKDEDIAVAHKITEAIPARLNITAEQYAELATIWLRDFSIDYSVEIVDKHGFQGRPDHKNKVLRISKYLSPDFLTVEGLVKHELVHIIRAVNGSYNRINPQKGYLATDEGLASLVQDKLLKTPTSSSFQHAVEYLATRVALTSGFRDVYDYLVKHGCSPENAWARGIRLKYGIQNTAEPGCLMRSAMCFYHELKISKLDYDKIHRLFVGKINSSLLDEYPIYIGKIPLSKIELLLSESKTSQR